VRRGSVGESRDEGKCIGPPRAAQWFLTPIPKSASCVRKVDVPFFFQRIRRLLFPPFKFVAFFGQTAINFAFILVARF
jgi:hypothetical protein